MLASAALTRPCAPLMLAQGPRDGPVRVQAPAATTLLRCRRRQAAAAAVRASAKPGGEEGMAAVGSDLNWGHVARDVKRRLAAAAGGHESKQAQLQSW